LFVCGNDIKKKLKHVHTHHTHTTQEWWTFMPYCKFILPTAPTQSVTMNMGMKMASWYDIIGLDERSNEHCDGIEESYQFVQTIMEQEHTTTNLPYSRMILCGFSQGGALSIFTGYQSSSSSLAVSPVGGIVCMSGYVPALKIFHVDHPEIPLLQCHGTQDPLVPYPMAQKSYHLLKEQYHLSNLQFKEYTMGHTVHPQEIKDVVQFMQTILPNDPTYQITIQDPNEMSLKQLKQYIQRIGLTSQTFGFLEKYEYIQLIQNYRNGT
jgi:lysophospholipase II